MSKMKDLLLDYDVCDSITISSLLQSYDNLLYNKEAAGEGCFCHPEDKAYYDEMLNAIEKVIKYYTVDSDELIRKTIRERQDDRASRKAKFRMGKLYYL